MLATVMVIGLGVALAQPDTKQVTQHLAWRCIGPHRGGRTVGAVGIPGRPNEFLIGVNNGGVWKTSDYGRTWVPVFDDQPTGSIGWVTVAPSRPDTVYVGSGEGLQRPDLSVGDGVYRSDDGGQTWRHVGLEDASQIPCIEVDPRDPEHVYVAVLGHPYGPNGQRGLFESKDGGATWSKILGPDADTGASQIVIDPTDPDTLYCALWSARLAPWENGTWRGPGSGLFKSTDGGKSWRAVMNGLPTIADGLGRVGLGLAPSQSKVLYLTVDARQGGGIYKSDDGGDTWRLLSTDRRLWGRGDDFAEIKVDPKDPDTVYCANVACYKSTDGGRTWVSWKGAPGGDDYHTIWISPTNPAVVLLSADQGATITVNGGVTWSSWYNQPTAQFYHVSTDNQWPYWVYGGQQESGSVGMPSRGNDGQLTFREWHPVGVEEYGYVAVDPRDPNIVYGGKLTRYDKRTGQVQNVAPPGSRSDYRVLRTQPVLFSPVDDRLLYFAGSKLFATRDGGHSWKTLSPDLSRAEPDVPESFMDKGKPMQDPGRRGVIYAVGPSHFTTSTIWCGTDDGLVWLTSDGGKTWDDVTPPGLTSWSKVTQIEGGRFDDDTAYVSVNRIRCDDLKPYVYVTHDRGKTWRLAVDGLPDDPVNAVREDPKIKGLLYCATERMVHYSTNDGGTWRPLRLNMPCTSVRDLVVHEDDLVIGTHGRSFWILDNVSSLRQAAQTDLTRLVLFDPQMATRVRWSMNTDTPLPPEEPAGKNPPDGAMIDYWLPSAAKSVKIEVFSEAGDLVRAYTSSAEAKVIDAQRVPVPEYWLRPPSQMGTGPGAHRWLWDMRWDPITEPGNFVTMAAIVGDTPTAPLGPWAKPGRYRVRLTVDGELCEAWLDLRLDPRVKTPRAGIELQGDIAAQCYSRAKPIQRVLTSVKQLIDQQAPAPAGSKGAVDYWRELDKKFDAPLADGLSLRGLCQELVSIMKEVCESDTTPTKALQDRYRRAIRIFDSEATVSELLKSPAP